MPTYRQYAAEVEQLYSQFETRTRTIFGSTLSTTTWTPTATPVVDVFDGNPANALRGNIKNGALPAPRVFLAAGIGVLVCLENLTALANRTDLAIVIHNTFLDYRIGEKSYYDAPIWDAPAPGGMFGSASLTAAETTAIATNGWPVSGDFFKFQAPGQLIREQQQQRALLSTPAGARTLSVSTLIYVVVPGIEFREVQ